MSDERTRSLRAADYFLAVHGLAMTRSLMTRPAELRRRTEEGSPSMRGAAEPLA